VLEFYLEQALQVATHPLISFMSGVVMVMVHFHFSMVISLISQMKRVVWWWFHLSWMMIRVAWWGTCVLRKSILTHLGTPSSGVATFPFPSFNRSSFKS